MHLPKLPYTLGTSVLSQVSFSSLNETPSCRDGGIKDMTDISGKDFPFLSSRDKRTEFVPQKIGYKILGAGFEKEFYIVVHKENKSYFYYGGKLKGEWNDDKAQKKQFAVINRYICIFPDAVYYKTEDTKGIEQYKAEHDCETEYECKISFTYENEDGTIKEVDSSVFATVGNGIKCSNAFCAITNTNEGIETPPTINKVFFEGDTVNLYREKDGDILESVQGISKTLPIKITKVQAAGSSVEHACFATDIIVFKKNDNGGMFNKIKRAVPEEYCERFGFLNPSFDIVEIKSISGDTVGIIIKTPEMFDFDENGCCVTKVEKEFMYSISSDSTISIFPDLFGSTESLSVINVGFSYYFEEYGTSALSNVELCVYVKKSEFQETDVLSGDFCIDVENRKIKNKLPNIDLICADNNRLFAVSTGTLYACAIGDPFTWFRYEGTDADCYAVDIVGSGDFTALFSFGGVVNIFRSDRVIKLYGDVPSEFQTYEVICDGIRSGCSGSVCVISGNCYYISGRGVELYNASMPSLISERIKPEFKEICAATSDGRRYYVSGGKDSLYVYDTETGGWYKEKKLDFFQGFKVGTSAYAVSECGITLLSGNDTVFTDKISGDFPFFSLKESTPGGVIEFGDFYLDTFNKKRVHRLILRIFAANGCTVKIYISYDGKPFERVTEYYADEYANARLIPIIPKRCDKYKLKIESDKYFRLEGIATEVSSGGM